jgi:hypothetical protein
MPDQVPIPIDALSCRGFVHISRGLSGGNGIRQPAYSGDEFMSSIYKSMRTSLPNC